MSRVRWHQPGRVVSRAGRTSTGVIGAALVILGVGTWSATGPWERALEAAEAAEAAATQPARAVSRTVQGLPEAPGAEETARRCLTCHEADLIVQQRLTEGGWDRELTKMTRWGAVVPEGERATILRYLAQTFGPRPYLRADAASVADGERIHHASCLACHAEDLAAQQRLNRAGWIREIEKMVRWGARVTDEQKAPLADYLTSRWGRP